MFVCFIGDCGVGKTTLSIAMLMSISGGNINVTRKENLQYIYNQHIMYPGVISSTVATIGMDRVESPGQYIQAWYQISPRPVIFMADGGKFIDLDLLKKVAISCKVMVFDLKVSTSIANERCIARECQNPRTWP